MGSGGRCQMPVRRKKYLWDMEVYEYSSEAEARARTGRKPVGFKWLDANKGSAEAPRYPSRLVRTEVRHNGVEAIFSATPPLETLRVLLNVACQEDVFRVEDPFLITTADVSRAHLYADAVRDVYVRLPDEDPKAQEPGVCVGNSERRCTVLWMLPNVGVNTMIRLWRREDFPEAGLLCAISPLKACKHTFWCMLTIFHSGPM